MGKNTLGKIPPIIASCLKLPDAKLYTEHCMRRTSATVLADSGFDLTTVKRLGDWNYENVAEAYIESAAKNKTLIAKQIVTDNKNNENDASASRDETSTSKTSKVSVVGNRNNEFLVIINVNININK